MVRKFFEHEIRCLKTFLVLLGLVEFLHGEASAEARYGPSKSGCGQRVVAPYRNLFEDGIFLRR
jgi:hypothetical protein